MGTYEDAGVGAEEVNGENVNRDESSEGNISFITFGAFMSGSKDKFETFREAFMFKI